MKNKTLLKISLFTILVCSCTAFKPAKEKFMPGYSSNSLEDLNKPFKKKVEKLIVNMQKRGYNVDVSQTFRDYERQEYLFETSLKLKKLTGQDIKVTTTKRSHHNHTHNGMPASCAVDLRPVLTYLPHSQVEFYKVMRDEAKKLGLRSGADFKRTTFFHKKYDIGWDPGHIYTTSCK